MNKKRLINFRGTQDFAHVETRGGSGATLHGPLWAACNPSPFEQSIKATRFIKFTAPTQFNFSVSAFGAPAFYITGLTIPFVNTTSNAGAAQPSKAFRPVSFEKVKPPCPPKRAFVEQTFEQVQEQYRQNNIARTETGNVQPMESQ